MNIAVLNPIPADIQERYNRIERQVAERSNTLQMTRMQCLSLQDSLHSLLIWLEEKENTFDKLERGTRMMIKTQRSPGAASATQGNFKA